VQHTTYRISKAAPILSYLPRFIKIVRADSERSPNMPKHPQINYPPLDRLLQKTPKNRVSVLFLSHPEFNLNPAWVLSSPATVTVLQSAEYTRHFLKTTFSDSCDHKTWRFIKISKLIFFQDDNTFPIGKVKTPDGDGTFPMSPGKKRKKRDSQEKDKKSKINVYVCIITYTYICNNMSTRVSLVLLHEKWQFFPEPL